MREREREKMGDEAMTKHTSEKRKEVKYFPLARPKR